MTKIWHDTAWEDYLNWQTQDKKTLKKINKLLKDIVLQLQNCCSLIMIPHSADLMLPAPGNPM